jgi:UDP-3-O-[3-hydroxymyristoyl] glucosamine N-acyltransferase
MPFMPHAEWLRNAVHLRRLDRMAKRLRKEEDPGEDLERNDD